MATTYRLSFRSSGQRRRARLGTAVRVKWRPDDPLSLPPCNAADTWVLSSFNSAMTRISTEFTRVRGARCFSE